MSKIRQLDAHLTNMIAAGEVVERPAGIIKELVENSLDARATSITIKVIEGGMGQIEVSDDGIGMGKEDLSLAFDRHSTSKIHIAKDLNEIQTFGFRGEALPSIASVSIVEAISNNGEGSHKIAVNNGVKSPVTRLARNKGTTILIKELFLRTPARLKYIKNISYENAIILETVQKFAMGNPSVAFQLMIDNRLSFQTYGKDNVKDVFHRIHGSTVTQDAIIFEAENFDFKIQGIYAKPQFNKSNRNAIWLYINNRMIRYPKAQKAIIEGFRRHMPTDRYPIVVLKITVSPNLVDVNVHPSKWEIRLSKEQELVSLILNSFEQELLNKTKVKEMSFQLKEKSEQTTLELYESVRIENPYLSNSSSNNTYLISENISNDNAIFPNLKEEPNKNQSYERFDDSVNEVPALDVIEPLKVLSQMSGKYILCQGEKGLYILDQHAAMERVRYEYYQDRLLEQKHLLQDLLVPHVFEGRAKLVFQLERVNQILDIFQCKLEPISDDSLVLRSIPTWIKAEEVSEFINKVLDMIEDDKSVREEDLRRRAIATLACHSSVRFNEYLSMEEMEALVSSLRRCKQPLHCPHGRPTLMVVEHRTLEKEFSR